MRQRTILLDDQLDDAATRALARDLVRLGADARPMLEAGRVVAFAAVLDEEAASRMAKKTGVARVLSAPEPHPLAGHRGGGPRVVRVRAGSARDHVEIGGDAPVV